MSISPDFSEGGRFSGRELPVRGGGGGLEKSNFSQTCSLLSQYLKENGRSFGDLSLGMNRSSNVVEGKPETFRQAPIRTVKSMDLFPEHAGFGTAASSVPPSMETVTNKADFSTTLNKEPETAQMTIFYAGKVHVFDNFSMEKAKELMMLASKASSGNERPNTVAAANNLTQELSQRIPQRIASDLPIARKASLHRFLEKRKDRINSRAPYQINQSSSSSSVSIPDKTVPVAAVENKTWLGLGPQSTNPFQLQL